jgi:hypothetical protein
VVGLHVAAATTDVILEFTPDGVEGVTHSDLSVLMRLVPGTGAGHHQLAMGHG